MKTVLLAGAFLLSSSMFVAAQSQSPASTPPTLPQSQSQPAPDQQPSANPSSPSSTTSPSSTMPSSDTSAQSSASQASSQEQKIEGCLSQTSSGFALAEASGTTYNLTGDTSKLSSHVGEEVEVKGMPASGSASSSAAPNATESSAGATGSTAGTSSGQSFTVHSVKRIAKSCSNAGGAQAPK